MPLLAMIAHASRLLPSQTATTPLAGHLRAGNFCPAGVNRWRCGYVPQDSAAFTWHATTGDLRSARDLYHCG
jgi:hypothetical protein